MGKAAQGAGNAVNNANDKSAQSAGAANAAAGAAPGAPAGGAAGQSAPGLSSVGLQFQLRGDFFDLADFFHRMKRFVRVVNGQIVVRGRLLTIDNFSFSTTEGGELKAEVSATVYLSPKAQGGVSVGASPTGPAPTPGGGGSVAADPASQSPSPSGPPAATATP
jgi:hypothetical protein